MTTTASISTKTAGNTSPQIAEVSVAGQWQGALSTGIKARTFDFTVSEPTSFGGANSGANPIEYVLGGFQGCVAVVVETVARERDIRIDDLRLDITGSLDLRGFAGVWGVSPSIQTIVGEIHLDADLEHGAFGEFVAEIERRCPVYNLLRDAGVKLEIRWSLN
ncbi:MAG TPA: OsmC family protein [Actinomycetaceae bacterium]|nr:OsmC family protein [Actinomycetaceae bacterium]